MIEPELAVRAVEALEWIARSLDFIALFFLVLIVGKVAKTMAGAK